MERDGWYVKQGDEKFGVEMTTWLLQYTQLLHNYVRDVLYDIHTLKLAPSVWLWGPDNDGYGTHLAVLSDEGQLTPEECVNIFVGKGHIAPGDAHIFNVRNIEWAQSPAPSIMADIYRPYAENLHDTIRGVLDARKFSSALLAGGLKP